MEVRAEHLACCDNKVTWCEHGWDRPGRRQEQYRGESPPKFDILNVYSASVWGCSCSLHCLNLTDSMISLLKWDLGN